MARSWTTQLHEGTQATLGKNIWKAAVWEVLHERYLQNNLHTPIFAVPAAATNPLQSLDEPMGRPSASSSSLQESLNAPPDTHPNDVGTGAFPKSDDVEEAPMIVIDDDESQQGSDKVQEDIETSMERWVEQVECVQMLENIDWLHTLPESPENSEELMKIFKFGMNYCTIFLDGCLQPWHLKDWPLNPRLWLAEMERTLKVMAKRWMLPYWLRRPHDKNIRDDASASADGSTDPGNYVLDVVVHSLRLWQYCESGRINRVMKQSIAEYGERCNKSATGPVNLRGNIVEAMQRDLQKAGTSTNRREKEYDAVAWWWQWEADRVPARDAARNTSHTRGTAASSSSWGGSRISGSRWHGSHW